MKNKTLIDENYFDYYTNISVLGYGNVEIFDEDFSDEIELQICDFNKECDALNKEIIDISCKLIMQTKLLNFVDEVDKLTNKVGKLDENIDIIRADINFFGRAAEFNGIFSELIDSIIQVKQRLKILKILQVTLFDVKIEYINKKVDELNKIVNVCVDEKIIDMISSLKKMEENTFEVTDWKYSKHRNIDYEKINEICETISVIEDRLGIIEFSSIKEILDCYKKIIDSKIFNINSKINKNVFLDDIDTVKRELNNLINLVYLFLTVLYLNKDDILNEQYMFYLEWINKSKTVMYSIDERLITNKIYKNIKEELTYRLKIIDTKIDIFSKYVDIHCINSNNLIFNFDEEELLFFEQELDKIISDIEFRREQLVESQYSGLIRIYLKMMKKIDEIGKKINNSFKVNLPDMCVVGVETNGMSKINKNNKFLKVINIKNGKEILKKHNKLVLISAGLISLVLLIRKFLLIPAIMYGNVKLGNMFSKLNSTVIFFNKILGSIIGATISVDGMWYLVNGSLLDSRVVSTSLLKGLVIGNSNLDISLISSLMILIKELVEKMKVKDRKQKLVEDMNDVQDKYDNFIGKSMGKLDKLQRNNMIDL